MGRLISWGPDGAMHELNLLYEMLAATHLLKVEEKRRMQVWLKQRWFSQGDLREIRKLYCAWRTRKMEEP